MVIDASFTPVYPLVYTTERRDWVQKGCKNGYFDPLELQGRMAGSKKRGRLRPVIPNDNQIYRVTVEKSSPPKQSLNIGDDLTIRKYRIGK
jgi:hypothetical protein